MLLSVEDIECKIQYLLRQNFGFDSNIDIHKSLINLLADENELHMLFYLIEETFSFISINSLFELYGERKVNLTLNSIIEYIWIEYNTDYL